MIFLFWSCWFKFLMSWKLWWELLSPEVGLAMNVWQLPATGITRWQCVRVSALCSMFFFVQCSPLKTLVPLSTITTALTIIAPVMLIIVINLCKIPQFSFHQDSFLNLPHFLLGLYTRKHFSKNRLLKYLLFSGTSCYSH